MEVRDRETSNVSKDFTTEWLTKILVDMLFHMLDKLLMNWLDQLFSSHRTNIPFSMQGELFQSYHVQ